MLEGEELREALEKERAVLREELASGEPGPARKEVAARSLVADVIASISERRDIEVRATHVECLAVGCVATIRFESAGAHSTAEDELIVGEVATRWRGKRVKTGPLERSDGTVEVDWFLFYE